MADQFATNQEALKVKGVKVIGNIVWWTITGDHLRSTVDYECTKTGLKPPRKQTRASYSCALSDVVRSEKGLVVKRIQDEVDLTVSVIAETSRDTGNRKLQIGDQEWIAFDKLTNDVTWKENSGRTKLFADRFQYHEEHYLNGDIRAIVDREINEMNPIRLRGSGGVYFVPCQYRDRLSEINDFLIKLGAGHLSVIAVPSADEFAKKSISNDFDSHSKITIDGMLNTLKETLKPGAKKKMVTQLVEIERDAESLVDLIDYKRTKLNKMLKLVRVELSNSLQTA